MFEAQITSKQQVETKACVGFSTLSSCGKFLIIFKSSKKYQLHCAARFCVLISEYLTAEKYYFDSKPDTEYLSTCNMASKLTFSKKIYTVHTINTTFSGQR